MARWPEDYIPPTLQWILDHIDHKGDECLEWPYMKCREGYGRVKMPDRRIKGAHRLMCEIVHGDPPAGKRVAAHSCGNRGCVNHAHIRWASHQENSDDMFEHGTLRYGANSTAAKLTENQVHEIRRRFQAGESTKGIARKYKVTASTIRAIRQGRTWAKLKTPGIQKAPDGAA